MTYQQALAARNPMAVFCERYVPRMVPSVDPATVWTRATWFQLDASCLAWLCAHDPDTVRKHLAV